MKRRMILFVTCVLAIAVQCVAAEMVNVSGKWEITSNSPRGERTREIQLVQDGEKLKVFSENRRGGKREANGTVKGNKIEWTVSRSTPMGDFTMTYKGTVTGDAIKGVIDTPRGSMEWTAKRIKN